MQDLFRVREFLNNHSGHSRLQNYVSPGLTSDLVELGNVRMFTNTRPQEQFITPHSHRFNFAACVLRGEVENTVYSFDDPTGNKAAKYQASILVYGDEPGKYEIQDGFSKYYSQRTKTYKLGDWYFMNYRDIHSIKFSHDAQVLMLEGKSITRRTTILQPVVNDQVVPTFRVEPWMFKK